MTRPYPPWDPAADDLFVCSAIRRVAPDFATVVFAPRNPATVAFEAGQYVTVEFTVDGRDVSRCYTIASPPTRPESIAITVRRTPSGEVSPWLHDRLRVGSTVRIGPPQGDFTLERHPAAAYLFLTAGSGITPALSVLRQAHDLGSNLDVVLVHSQRRAGDVPYRQELETMRGRPHLVCGEHDPASIHGRLDAALLERLVPDVARREIFVCGPDGYRETAREAAMSLGAAASRVHEESFVLTADPLPNTAAAASSGFRVEFRDLGTTVLCPPSSSVLDAAVAAGLPIAFSCTQGLCGTCKSTLVEGEVDMQHNGGIRPREIAAGKLLLCCSTPRSDLVISRL